jgi:ABC-type multidrug transport system ATPase subunit/pSer/pThr/pTyr-binding forkhead associated (FHA) protein/ABC-type multidrug transport system permease subunit
LSAQARGGELAARGTLRAGGPDNPRRSHVHVRPLLHKLWQRAARGEPVRRVRRRSGADRCLIHRALPAAASFLIAARRASISAFPAGSPAHQASRVSTPAVAWQLRSRAMSGGTQSGWDVQHGSKRVRLTEEGLILGRDPGCDVPIDDTRVSWHHARLELRGDLPLVTDLGSRNGTAVDGVEVTAEPRVIEREAVLQLGDSRLRLAEHYPEPSARHGRFRRVAVDRALRIGRAPDNDIVLAEPSVSRYHAEIRAGNPAKLIDLGSRNGVRLGHQHVSGVARLDAGAVIGIGPFTLRYEGREAVVVDERGLLTLRADEVGVQIGGEKTILHPTSLQVTSGEFVALIGPSGSGKSTLLKCMAGIREPTRGSVMIDEDALALRLSELGYVPQADVVHERLTVTEALRFAARLRLPSDTTSTEWTAAVDDVLGELRLVDHSNTLVERLSGGQRKRVACGVELIGRPAMLLLDEPTSGLDPALERRLMLTLRRLADAGRGVLVVTHATSSLSMCDTVAVMGPSGQLLFAGAPRDCLAHFQVDAYDGIYAAMELVATPARKAAAREPVLRPPRRRLLSGRSLRKHLPALTARYARTLLRDRRTLLVQLGQAPIIGVLIALLFPSHLLALPGRDPSKAAQFIFLLVTAALWLGLTGSCREIVKERSVILRELAVGVRLDAYVLSKSSLLFTLAGVQCLLLAGTAYLLQPLHAATQTYLELTFILLLAGCAAAAMGLIVSTLARSVDQATSLIPLLLIPLLLFGGALEPLATVRPPIRILSDLMISRWAFAGGGNTVDMNFRLAQAPRALTSGGYGQSFFSLGPGVAAGVLVGFAVAFVVLTAALLARRSRLADI